MAPLTFGFLMDPLERVDITHDTTFAFLREAHARGHRLIYLRPDELTCLHGVPYGLWRTIAVRNEQGDHFAVLAEERAPLESLDVLFLRVDPPFDMPYIFDTYFAELIEDSTFVMNRPQGIRDCSEKFFTMHFPDLVPPSLITQDARDIKPFMDSVGGEAIIKPLDSFGGQGVFFLTTKDTNLNSILEMSTEHGRKRVIVQQYIPQVAQGDKRILLLNGNILGGLNRIPPPGEARSNMAVGGRPAPLELTDRDREIAAAVGPELVKRGLYFVGLDVIGGYLTEVNVTSPTGVQEADRLDNVNLEAQVIDFVESRCSP